MTWLIAGPLVLLFIGAALLFPYATLWRAVQNGTRVDGSRSSRRTRRERIHFLAFVWEALLAPALTLFVVGAGFFGLHEYVVRDTTLADIFGPNHPEVALHSTDLGAWEEAIAASQRERDEADARMQEKPFKQVAFGLLTEHWPIHAVFPILAVSYLVWFLRRRFIAAAKVYHAGVAQRSARYRRTSTLSG